VLVLFGHAAGDVPRAHHAVEEERRAADPQGVRVGHDDVEAVGVEKLVPEGERRVS